jgi:hypothetical protein
VEVERYWKLTEVLNTRENRKAMTAGKENLITGEHDDIGEISWSIRRMPSKALRLMLGQPVVGRKL